MSRRVCCPKCNRQIGVIDEDEPSITFDKGVKVGASNVAMGMLIAPYTCPGCGLHHTRIVTI